MKPTHESIVRTIDETDISTQTLMKGRDIVIIGLQPWYYDIGSNCKNIATWFAKHNRVLYVNLPINRKTYLSSKKNPGIEKHCDVIRSKGEKIRSINDNMWELFPTSIVESINGLPSNKLFKVINYFNNRRFARNIHQAVEELGFTDIILFNDNDIYNGFYLKEMLKPSLYIYYCRDFLPGYDYWKKHASILEPQLIRKADLAVTNSLYYAEYCSEYNANSHYIGQGCDFELFDYTKEEVKPEDLDTISGPLIGYTGALDSARLDVKIIELIAKSHSNWNVVLVGPEDDFFLNSQLHGIPNVHFLGRKPLKQLSAYVRAFDICINPQFQNQITRGNYPLKIDEYLALGKQVVATRTQAMKLFEGYVYLADNPEQYPSLIENALRDDNKLRQEKSVAFARSHNWGNCMEALYREINATAKKR